MASASSTTNGRAKVTAAKSAAPKAAAAPAPTPKPAAAKRRTAARPKSPTARKSSKPTTSRTLPQWVTIGASVTGAVFAVGATLFATRGEWLPRAKKLGEWVENAVHDQLDNFTAIKSKAVGNASKLHLNAPKFEHSDANGNLSVGHTPAE